MGCKVNMMLAALGAASPLAAAEPVAVRHSVFVEREVPTDDGETARVLEPAHALRRGDRVVYFVAWRAPEGETFTITNPLPRTVAYQRTADGFEDVSVDGGRTWSKLEQARVRQSGGWRVATPEDVTHVRWKVPRQLALAGSGRLTWSGVVR
jgi:hypothetical protein